jgi:hypothetical protein
LSPSRFVVTQEGGTQAPPVVTSVIRISGPIMRVILNKPIEPGAWTTISDTLSDISLKVGFLPGDVNSNGAASPADILTLVDSLNGMTNLKVWSSDLDRTGAANPADIIALIDLLNGTGGNVPWNGVSLP